MHDLNQRIENIPYCILEAFLGNITKRKIYNLVIFGRYNGIPTKTIIAIIHRFNKINRNNIKPITTRLIQIITGKIDHRINIYKASKAPGAISGNTTLPTLEYASYDLTRNRYVLLSGEFISVDRATNMMKRKPRPRKKNRRC